MMNRVVYRPIDIFVTDVQRHRSYRASHWAAKIARLFELTVQPIVTRIFECECNKHFVLRLYTPVTDRDAVLQMGRLTENRTETAAF